MYEKFAELCKKNSVTPYQVSKATGVSQAVLSDWKLGKSTPKIDKLKMISAYFCVDINYFLSDTKQTVYYVNDDTKEIAQKIFNNKELRLLFDAAQDATSDDLKTVHTMLLALKRKEGRLDE